MPLKIKESRYPERNCPHRYCLKKFKPNRSNQVYCSNDCRINENNDIRKERDMPLRQMNKEIKFNEMILKKIYSIAKQNKFSGQLLVYENFVFGPSVTTFINETNKNNILWFLQYGLEKVGAMTGEEITANSSINNFYFIIHYKETLKS